MDTRGCSSRTLLALLVALRAASGVAFPCWAILLCAANPVIAAPSSLPDPDTEIARRHFDAGTALYADSKYAEAMVEFESAKRAKPLPAFDYNIARCLDRLERWAEAAVTYERYATTLDAGTEADEVRARAATLRKRLVVMAPVRVALSAPKAPPEEPARPTLTEAPLLSSTSPLPFAAPPRRIATWVVGGAGAAALVGSVIAGVVAQGHYSDLSDQCDPGGGCNSATVSGARSRIDDGRNAGIASDVLLGVGLAAVAAGVVLYFVEGRHHHIERAPVAVTP